MPRSHARISLRIWSDADWLDLPMHAQWLYLALVSQEGINHAGILSLTRRRWAKLCADRDADTVDDAVKVLTDRRFIVVDEDTEQVLVRTFVRNDEVWRQPNTLKNACASIRLVTSPVLRAALLSELLRLDMAKIEKLRAAEGHERAHEVLRATIAALAGDHPRSPDPDRSTPSDGYVCDPYADPIPATPSNPLPRRRAGEGDGEGVVLSRPGATQGGGRAPRPQISEPTSRPRCRRHIDLPPDDPGPPCVGCRDARLATERAAADEQARRSEAATAKRAALTACTRCDEAGWVLADDGTPVEPARRCTHAPPGPRLRVVNA